MCSPPASAFSRSMASLASAMALLPLRELENPGIEPEVRDEPLVALDTVFAAACPRLFEDHQHRWILRLEDAQVTLGGIELRELALDRQHRQPVGNINQLDQPFDGNRGLLDLAANFVRGSGLGLLLRGKQARPLVGLPTMLHIMRLDSLQKCCSRQATCVDPALCPGPSG